jgi:hypothetical protein
VQLSVIERVGLIEKGMIRIGTLVSKQRIRSKQTSVRVKLFQKITHLRARAMSTATMRATTIHVTTIHVTTIHVTTMHATATSMMMAMIASVPERTVARIANAIRATMNTHVRAESHRIVDASVVKVKGAAAAANHESLVVRRRRRRRTARKRSSRDATISRGCIEPPDETCERP